MDENKELLFPEKKVTNYPLYFYRIFGKIFALVIFGVGTVLLAALCFPICKLIFRPKTKFRYHTRYLIYILFNVFIKFLWLLRVIRIKVDKKNYLNKLESAIVVANHSAYLDSFVMLAQLKHATIIPKASLSERNVMKLVINELYTPNSVPFDEIVERAKEDFANGNTLIMFPEGTRSTPYGQNYYKKGAARISLATGVPIIPVYIGGNSKKGLGKGDKIFEYNHSSIYSFDLHIKEPVYPDEFKDLPGPIAAKRLTDKIRDILSDEANAQYRY
ncbi:lysophospholipid acyltransferase family protein [Treponema ruminis]|uniref:1-acyl-sn-glycerol-3-phosphate acyltransferase n=1 Tax=Treponema ruminis TaxID=744515 RepID=A0A7W8LL11_9SPIR|nr:lysophospholipid acyltransferase family protein [Treponema ruminis]MBB5224855.1 1-acyl-sn-glycerol-3-phosphate acyltransferase [Treponema ruminis]